MNLFEAIAESNNKVIIDLIQTGVNINQKNASGDTPLIIAAWEGNHELVETLLNAGAKIDTKSREKLTALRYAIETNHTKVSHLLIDRGANINAQDSKGKTILMEAILRGNVEIIEKIISKNVNILTEDILGHTALNKAIRCRMIKVAEILIQKGLKPYQYILFDAIDTNCIETVNFTIGLVRDLNSPRLSDGETPLMFSIFKRRTEIAKLLIRSGADVSLTNNQGKTALDYAKESKNNEIVQHILSLS